MTCEIDSWHTSAPITIFSTPPFSSQLPTGRTEAIMASKSSNGKGGTPNPAANRTAEENDNIRRAKKAKQRSSGGRTPNTGAGYLDGLLADRRVRAEAARHEREAEQYYFRVDQARKATEHRWFQELKPGTVSYTVAQRVLDEFPLADPREGVSRTQMAIANAIEALSDEQAVYERAVRHGVRVAQAALRWSYDQLKAA